MYVEKYFSEVQKVMATVLETQKEKMECAAEKIVETCANNGRIFFFGCTHAGILSQEAFYRTGGLVVVNPILPPGLTCDVEPITLTSQMERMDGYGAKLSDANGITKGDLIFIHSVSGRNAVPVDMAVRAREVGAYVIAITSIEYSEASSPRAKCGLRLFEAADMVIDNCGTFGDALVQVDDFPQKVAPSSTVVGCSIVNAIVAESVHIFLEKGMEPPVFLSANIDGGDAYNDKMLKKYADKITYMGHANK